MRALRTGSMLLAAALWLVGSVSAAESVKAGKSDKPALPLPGIAAPTAPAAFPGVTDRRPACRPTQKTSLRPQGEILGIRWTDGPDDLPVEGTATHFVTLNLIVTTAGYRTGDCVKVTVRSEDGSEIAEGVQQITVTGRVDERGIARFKEPLRPYTILLFNPDRAE